MPMMIQKPQVAQPAAAGNSPHHDGLTASDDAIDIAADPSEKIVLFLPSDLAGAIGQLTGKKE